MKAEEIQEEIERTRGDMAGTIDAIERRLNPRQLMDQAVDTMRDLTSEDTNVGRMVRDNPVPLALIGLGLGWLAVSSLSRRDEEAEEATYGGYEGGEYEGGYEGVGMEGAAVTGSAWGSPGTTETARSSEYGYGGYSGGTSGYGADAGYSGQESQGQGKTAKMRERASQMAGQAREGLKNATQESRMKMSKMTRSARYQASHAADRTWETYQDHPLTMGFIAAMMGAAIGAILPRSRTEREVMGQQAGQMISRVRETAGDLADRAGHVASAAVDKVREEAKEAMHDVTQAAKEEAKAQGLTGQKGGQGSSLTH